MNGWVRLRTPPLKSGPYLVAYRDTDIFGNPDPKGKQSIGIAFYQKKTNEWLRGDGNRADSVFSTMTHWMLEPELPNE